MFTANSFSNYQTTVSGGQTFNYQKPRSEIAIYLLKEPVDGYHVIDAVMIKKSLTEKYNIKSEKKSD